MTILIVTHNMQQAARVSDFTAYMYLGELIEFGVTDEHLHQAQEQADRGLHHRQVRIGCADDSDHASKQYDLDLGSIRSRVLAMGGLVESQIRRAIDALTTGSIALSDEVIEADHRVNAMEVSLDEDCSQLIVRRQPAAGDLRMIFAIMKTVTDLERIGDEAQKIARMAKNIHERGGTQAPPVVEVRHAARGGDLDAARARSTASRAWTATARREVIRDDAGIDTEFRSILRQLITYMMEDPRTITTSLEIVWIAKAIERIGDHAKNMAEYVIYIVKGTDVRHTGQIAVARSWSMTADRPGGRGRAADPGAGRGQPRAQRPQGAARRERRGGRGLDPQRAARRAGARLDAAGRIRAWLSRGACARMSARATFRS